MPKVIKSGAREAVIKVHSFCVQECESNEPIIPLKSVNARVAAMIGISERSVQRIDVEGKYAESTSSKIVTPGKTRKRSETKCNLDDFDLGVVQRKIHQLYTVKKEIPTLPKLLVEIKNDIQYSEMLGLVQDAFQAVTAAAWKTHCEHVERLEVEYRNDDIELENFNICLASDSDTSCDITSSELEDLEDHLFKK